MTVAQAITAIRAATLHDADTQVTDAQLTTKIDQAYRRLRRRLGAFVPSLFETVDATITIAAAASSFAKPATFERLILLERLISGSNYYPLLLKDKLNANQPALLTFYEQSTTFVVMPASAAPGSYRLTYVAGPAAAEVVGGDTLSVPQGLEDIIIQEVAAFVRTRHNESPAEHLDEIRRIWKEELPVLKRRYGVHPVPGLVRTRVA